MRVKINDKIVFCPDDLVNYPISNIYNETILNVCDGYKTKKFRQILGKVGLFLLAQDVAF